MTEGAVNRGGAPPRLTDAADGVGRVRGMRVGARVGLADVACPGTWEVEVAYSIRGAP